MNLLTQIFHLLGSSASAYMTALYLCDRQTRPNLLAGFQLAESGSVPFLTALSDRAKAEGKEWLAQKLLRHADDERRHGQIFAQALKQMNKQVIDFKNIPQTTTEGQPSSENSSPFFAAYFQGYSQTQLKPENIDWVVFMASTYILELDASKDFNRMAQVLPTSDLKTLNLKKGILSIAKDETYHATYLYEALERELSAWERQRVIDQWRERKVNALLAMVSNFIEKGGKMRSLSEDSAEINTADSSMLPAAS